MTIAANYDDVLGQMEEAGLIFESRDLPLTYKGMMKRVKVKDCGSERKGWYVLHEFPVGTDTLLVGSFGVWHGDGNNAQKVELKKRTLDAEQSAALKARLAEDRKIAEAARKAEAERSAQAAADKWRECIPDVPGNPYLERKGVGAHGVRFAPEGMALEWEADDGKVYKTPIAGAVCVPFHDHAGRIHALQFIYNRRDHAERIERTGRDKDTWPRGAITSGRYFLIGTPGPVILVAEGYATGATLHECTGLPVAIAFFANNLRPVAEVLHKKYRTARLLICADDDFATHGNPGVTHASAAALAVNGAYVAPVFKNDPLRAAVAQALGPTPPTDRTEWKALVDPLLNGRSKLTDFNDLASTGQTPTERASLVRDQIDAKLFELNWHPQPSAGGPKPKGGGEKRAAMPSMLTVEEAVERYWGTYGLGGKALFDEVEHRLVHKDDVMNLLPERAWNDIKRHPHWRVARDSEIGFDPTEKDPNIKCNHFAGWPTVPKQGKCDVLLDLLEYLCSNEDNAREVFQWVLKWLAYPLQNPGAKMHSAIVVHGGQGTGKSRFFEAYAKIFGPYGRILGQEALEDKFNSDWAEAKLFILADEVLARQDMYQIKNRLKGFITGGTIRVNPKNVAAHNEKNQMNIVFLSNERMPLVLENDDRRHCVIWVPPKLPEEFFRDIDVELEAGGIAALHHYLLNLDLGDFHEWTKPPMTKSKEDLIELGRSSEERFLLEWQHQELEGHDGMPLPLCPCVGSVLYRAYEQWCDRHGERKRGMQHLISLAGKMHGWSAGKSERTVIDLSPINASKYKTRKMVIPSLDAMNEALKRAISTPEARQKKVMPRDGEPKASWLTACHFEFETALGVTE